MQAARLARAWQALGHEVLVAGHRIPDGETEGLETWRLPVIYSFGRGLRGLTLFLAISRLMFGRGTVMTSLIAASSARRPLAW